MKKAIYAVLACLAFASCEEFLDKQPIEEIGTDDFFKDESSLEQYTNGFINSYLPSATELTFGDGNCDIVQVTMPSNYLYQPVWNASLQGGWGSSAWTFVYYINTFLERMREAEGLSEEVYAHYEGTARFWRAWNYFELVKTFGAVPWYDYVILSTDTESLYKARDSREYVMDKVLEDLNFACEHCFSSSEWVNNTKINKWIALGIKSRICLFEGTYRKYHSVDPSTGKPWDPEYNKDNKWLREAADACEKLMNAGVYSLISSPANVASQYRSLFTTEAVQTQEVIWAREYNDALNVRHDITWYYTSGSMGDGWSLDADFVYTYLNLDGSRFTDDPDYKSKTYQEIFENKDYRLSQSIISPTYRKLVSGVSKLFAPNFSVSYSGYQVIKFNIDDDSYEASGICTNSLPILRYAEVLLNYAEAKAELGEFDDTVWDKTIRLLRERAGVNGDRPTQIDLYLQNYYYTPEDGNSKITDSDILEIRRERAIELLLEGRRYDDLMRWHLGHLLNKQWYGIYIGELNKAYDLNNDGTNDVCVVDGAAGTEPGVKYITLSATRGLEFDTYGRLTINLERHFSEQRYIHPVPKTAIDKNPNLQQNYMWIE